MNFPDVFVDQENIHRIGRKEGMKKPRTDKIIKKKNELINPFSVNTLFLIRISY